MSEELFMDPYIEEVIYLDRFTEVAWSGIEYAETLVDIIESISKSRVIDEDFKLSEFKRAEKLRIFALKEKTKGFPFLYRLAVIRLWSILEAAVDDLIIDNILKKKYSNKELFTKLKGSLLEFIQMTDSEQTEYILELLKNELKLNIKSGVGRFDGLLDAIELSGSIPEIIRRNLYELSQVRNCLVHRNSKVDLRLVKNCPWMDIRVGASITLTDGDFRKYQLTCYWYLLELSTRYEPKQDGIDGIIKLKEDIVTNLTIK
jgi:hypothetical protein